MLRRAAWVTDIHLNFAGHGVRERFLDEIRAQQPDIVLVGGDIGEAPSFGRHLRWMASALRLPIYFVLGNHDFYHGSVAGVRAEVRKLTRRVPDLVWLGAEEVVSLTEETALVGHDSWADGRLGDFWGSNVEMSDFHVIEELQVSQRQVRLERMQALADEAAEHIHRVLPKALISHRRVLLLTHVPPFREAAWHQGRTSTPAWLPFFSNKAMGDVLRSVMQRHPEHQLTVLCGHTHGHGECEILPNLRVLTGGAEYGRPQVQRVLDIA